MLKKCVMIAALAILITPAAARADWLFTPSIGSTFSTSSDTGEHFTYGAALGWMGAGILGWEADFSYSPEFFEPSDSDFDFVDSSNVVTVMGNVLVGIPIGGQTGGGFRPYVTGGIGLLRRQVESADSLFSVDSNDWGYNLGFGAIGFVSDRVGLRGDIRYTRSFQDLDDNFDAGSFHYWRGTGGVVFRW